MLILLKLTLFKQFIYIYIYIYIYNQLKNDHIIEIFEFIY